MNWLADASAPAWVQAVGSIVAIVASTGVVIWQHALDRKRDRELTQEKVAAARANLRSLADAVRGAAAGIKRGSERIPVKDASGWRGVMRFGIRSLEPMRNALATAPVGEFSSADVWSSWTLFVGCLDATLTLHREQVDWADTRSGNPVVTPEQEADVNSRLDDLIEHATELIEILDKNASAT